MAINALSPAFVRIFYQSDIGAHIMTRPTRAWTGTPWETIGTYTAWDETTVDADVMIEDFIDLMLPVFTPEVEFTRYMIFTQATPTSEPLAVYAKNLTGKVGTQVTAAQYHAYAKTYSYLSSGGGAAKLVLLDVPTGGVVSKSTVIPGGAEGTLVNYMMADTHAFAARDDDKIVAFLSVSNDVNDALQRKYRI
jgi:hypothetical protein